MLSFLAREHRSDIGDLVIAEMIQLKCKSKFRVYQPTEEYREQCSQILLVCSGEHPHPIPLPSKTPSFIRTELDDLIRSLDYDIPDLTTRRFLRHPTTVAFLKKRVPDIQEPMLSDLHPSLANRDHVKAFIQKIQDEMYPHGTGWDGRPTFPGSLLVANCSFNYTGLLHLKAVKI